MVEILMRYQDDRVNYFFTMPQVCSMFEDSESQVICQSIGIFLALLSKLINLYIYRIIEESIAISGGNTIIQVVCVGIVNEENQQNEGSIHY